MRNSIWTKLKAFFFLNKLKVIVYDVRYFRPDTPLLL